MTDHNLYTRNLRAKYRWYDPKHVSDRLQPYVKYLKKIEEYYANRKIVLEYKPIPQSGDGYMVRLGELDDTAQRQLYDMNLESIHEFDPDGDPNAKFSETRIKIIERSARKRTLRLERKPRTPKLAIFPNSYQIIMQRRAIWKLIQKPVSEHIPLLRLFHDNIVWPAVYKENVDEWFILRREVDGISEQKEFVKKALATPDFAFLEGPPGSGKTTVLCELVRQLVSRKKRVLFCASTHVAVDNLLERLADEAAKSETDLIPLRIGQSDKIAEKTKPFKYDNAVQTIEDRIRNHLASQKSMSSPQKMLQKVLEENVGIIGQIARDCANVVCGTTMGILGHPDIKDDTLRRFDVMIIDEASKTTLQEFLVPALYADRWIIVGDTNQLAPYTDDEEIAMHVDSCIGQTQGEACLDVFTARKRNHTVVVVTKDKDLKDEYRRQCEKLGVRLHDADNNGGAKPNLANGGQIVIGSPASILKMNPLSKKTIVIRNRDQLLDGLVRKKRNPRERRWASKCREPDRKTATWGEQMGWRIRTRHPNSARNEDLQKISTAINDLMPEQGSADVEKLLDGVRAVALPSVLECLKDGNSIMDCMPERSFSTRHVLLVWQYRMHPDIAAFSHEHVYNEEALRTPEDMKAKRDWSYDRYESRFVWIDVQGNMTSNGRSPSNKKEAIQVVRELEKFAEYAQSHPKADNTPWTIAILSFYTGQISEIRRHVQTLTQMPGPHSFQMQSVDIELHTVDSFQGHEADVVFLSLANERPTIFLNHLNRINVAITRARYQCVIVGNKKSMGKAEPPLRDLATKTEPVTGAS